jgi:heme/copper-type cytochrome/quinol oxidase subunit 3
VSELARHSTGYVAVEREPPEVMGRNLRVASHLWASATAFFFVAFLFAYFYLRTLNQHGLWHPRDVKAPVALGTLIAAVVAASAVSALAGSRRLRDGDDRSWRLLGTVALVLGLAAVVLQVVEWSTLGFGPTNGAFASVFVGWTGLYLLFVLGTLFWLETLLATSLRYHGKGVSEHEPGQASGDPGRTGDDIAEPLSLVGPGAEAFAFYWAFLAGIGLASWIVLYLL